MIYDACIEERNHIEQLCRSNDIEIITQNKFVPYYDTYCGVSDGEKRQIYIPTINSVENYYIALHELGHILHPIAYGLTLDFIIAHRRDIVWQNEAYAWEWALNNSIHPTRHDTLQHAKVALSTYLHDHRFKVGGSIPQKKPPEIFWALANY